ncbi:MAG TPA: HEAT repeat domain-containing protein [Oscillatoriaceae cyanobacterium]
MPILSIQAQRVRAIVKRFEAGEYDYWDMETVPVEDEATVLALLAGLRSPEWRAGLACVQALGRSRVRLDLVVTALVPLLRDAEDSIRCQVAEALGRIGPSARAAVPELVALIGIEQNGLVTQAALRALGQIGKHGELVVPRLVRMLACARRTSNAWQALHQAWHPARAMLSLVQGSGVFQDGFGLLRDSVKALGAFPAQAASSLPALRETLALELPGLKPVLVETIGRLGGLDAATVDRLVGLLAAPCTPAHEAAAMLVALVPYQEHHTRLLLALLDVPGVPDMAHDDPRPGVVRFLDTANPEAAVLARLVDALGDERPFVRERAARLLGACGAAAAFAASQLAERLQDPVPDVSAAAAQAIGLLGSVEAPVREALEAFERGEPDDARRAIAREALTNLGAPPPLPPGAFDAIDRLVAYLPFEGRPGRRVLVHGGKLYFAVHRILAKGDPSAWQTDEDAFGIAVFDPATARLNEHSLPLEFPIRHTGAAGARRTFRLEFELDGKLLFSLNSPFSDQRGWGDDNFLYLFDPQAARWSRLGSSRFSSTPVEQPLVAGPEDSVHSCSYGELVLWKDADGGLKVAVDGTPYHLDDWELAPQTAEALACARQFREAIERAVWTVRAVSEDVWELASPAGEHVKLFDVQALLAGLEPSGALPGGHLSAAVALAGAGGAVASRHRQLWRRRRGARSGALKRARAIPLQERRRPNGRRRSSVWEWYGRINRSSFRSPSEGSSGALDRHSGIVSELCRRSYWRARQILLWRDRPRIRPDGAWSCA